MIGPKIVFGGDKRYIKNSKMVDSSSKQFFFLKGKKTREQIFHISGKNNY